MIAELITKNMKDEAEAIEGYLPLLAALKTEGDEEGVGIIEDIIAEELKHSEILTAMLLKKSQLYVEPEGALEAITFIKKNAEEHI